MSAKSCGLTQVELAQFSALSGLHVAVLMRYPSGRRAKNTVECRLSLLEHHRAIPGLRTGLSLLALRVIEWVKFAKECCS